DHVNPAVIGILTEQPLPPAPASDRPRKKTTAARLREQKRARDASDDVLPVPPIQIADDNNQQNPLSRLPELGVQLPDLSEVPTPEVAPNERTNTVDEDVLEGDLPELSDTDYLEHSDLAAAFHSLKYMTDISNCLVPLLVNMGWRGHPRHVAEAIPHFVDELDITAFRNVMANLRYESWPLTLSLGEIDNRLTPCLFLPDNADAIVVLSNEGGKVRFFDGGTQQVKVVDTPKVQGTAYIFHQLEADLTTAQRLKSGWFRVVIERFRPLIYQTLILTFVLNLFALATPIFVMAVYDKVVATGSMETLSYFAGGVMLALCGDMVLRNLRAKVLAQIGARLDNIVGNAVFQRILFLPPTFTERATVGSQVARIKDFENVREFFTGNMALTFIELPFSVIFITVIAILGGPVAFVPMVMMVLFFLLSLVMQPLIQKSVSRASRGAARRQELVVETLSTMRAVKSSGGEKVWLERYRDDSARASLNGFYTSQYGALVQTLSSTMMTGAGLATVAFGVFRVLSGDMTIGALVACMILVWRVLGPLQTAFISLSRLNQVKSSIGQINALMNLKSEREPDAVINPLNRLKGRISFGRVSMRYSPESDPAVVGVSLDVEPGEVIAIIGGNGSGKSTLLKLLAGMYVPQAGSIRIDDQDLRQLDMIELRHAISYVPQTIEFFYGTIAQNLRLTHPTASDEELHWAAGEAGALDDILALEQGSGEWKRTGFDVRLGESSSNQLPTTLLQKLNLTRGYLKRSPIMLFDEPGNGLDYKGDQDFMAKIERMRGNTTVIIVTHRPSHMRIADKIAWMDAGHLRAFGPTEAVMQQLPKDFV
ncbi:MAG: ATP-binding cassette domain-containing protein, partial [Rhodospirillales bacterium]|nr:ATP-binding cassette domain-containing protein [Rhodospirillales bacterium]